MVKTTPQTFANTVYVPDSSEPRPPAPIIDIRPKPEKKAPNHTLWIIAAAVLAFIFFTK